MTRLFRQACDIEMLSCIVRILLHRFRTGVPSGTSLSRNEYFLIAQNGFMSLLRDDGPN